MSEFNITVEGGKSVKLLTGGKYCDRDIIVTAEGGGSGDVNMGTCTVKITVPSTSNYYVARENVSSGTVVYTMSKQYTGSTFSIKARCDSVMYIQASIKGAEVTDGEVLQLSSGNGLAYKTPSTNGATVDIILSN